MRLGRKVTEIRRLVAQPEATASFQLDSHCTYEAVRLKDYKFLTATKVEVCLRFRQRRNDKMFVCLLGIWTVLE